MPSTTFLASAGLILSLYAVYVEYKMEHKAPDEEFTALCDIEPIGASCSATFLLPEGRLVSYFGLLPSGHVLDVPNAALGAVYYLLRLLPLFSPKGVITKFLVTTALCTSIFLAYKLTVLHELCLLCWSTHVCNVLLFWNVFASSPESRGKVKTT